MRFMLLYPLLAEGGRTARETERERERERQRERERETMRFMLLSLY